MALFRKLSALPADGGSPIVSFPPGWVGEQPDGLVIEFADGPDSSWIGNFRKGTTGISQAVDHPNGRHAVIIADGPAWIVDPASRTAEQLSKSVDWTWLVLDPHRFILGDGQSFVCLDANGERWRTPPLTADAGFEDLNVEGERLRGKAWAVLTRTWVPFVINLETGAVYGGDNVETPFDYGTTAGLQDAPPLSAEGRRQLRFTRSLRRAAFASLLTMPLVILVLAAVNKLTGGATAIFAGGAAWTQVFWSALFAVMMIGVLLALMTVSRPCPRCQNGFFVSKGYGRQRSSTTSRGSVNVFARRCMNCQLPLSASD